MTSWYRNALRITGPLWGESAIIITWTSADSLSSTPFGINFSEVWIKNTLIFTQENEFGNAVCEIVHHFDRAQMSHQNSFNVIHWLYSTCLTLTFRSNSTTQAAHRATVNRLAAEFGSGMTVAMPGTSYQGMTATVGNMTTSCPQGTVGNGNICCKEPGIVIWKQSMSLWGLYW